MSREVAPRSAPEDGTEGMTTGDFATALKYLRTSDSITVTLDTAAFERAMEMATGGPEVMTTAQAAAVFGFGAKRWRRWAEVGRVRGAWLDHEEGKRGTWRLPREACRRVVEEERRMGRTRARSRREQAAGPSTNIGTGTLESRARRVGSGRTVSSTSGRRALRGPRKA